MPQKPCRIIRDLIWAKPHLGWPPAIPKPKRLRGCRAKGLTYERRVGRYLRKVLDQKALRGELHSGLWLEFEDINGHGFAQPDHFILDSGGLLLLECKLSQTPAAWTQLYGLYKPLLELIYHKPVLVLQVCKNLRNPEERIISSLAQRKDGSVWNYIH